MQNKHSETARGNGVYAFTFLRQLVALAIAHSTCREGLANAKSLIIVITLVVSLISASFVNTTISIDAFAKKKSSDRAKSGSNIRTDNSLQRRGEEEQQAGGAESLPLPVETPTNSKFVIINFDDSHESDYTYAMPILDKYGFKATFFEVCGWIEAGYHDKDVSATWEQIAALQQEGMDIEAHTMTHPDLNHKSQADLDYEIGQSKQCLENHGFNPTVFAYPNGEGADNPKVVNTVAKYYDLARTDTKSSALTLLQCGDGDGNVNNQQQRVYCGIYLNDGEVVPENRYSINSWAHKHIEEGCSDNIADNGNAGTCKTVRHEYDNAQMFQKFVSAVNSQYSYNKDGIVRAIPIIVYHTLVNYRDLSDSNRPIDTTVNLFDAEMRYLYENGFKVIPMSDLGYDANSRSVYIRGT
jgi:peptidoglycan/xylan/chitin deacetylase (PgdA/CDA1 family)